MDLSSHGEEIPVTMTSTYLGHHHLHTAIIHDPPPLQSNPPPPSPPPPPPPPQLLHEDSTRKVAALVKYRECLKNHAASIGGNVTDGCGEFMPSGEDGTPEAFRCSACHCHRNFHRKEVEGGGEQYCLPYDFYYRKVVGQKGVLISANTGGGGGGFFARPPGVAPHQMIMPLGALPTSESGDQTDGFGTFPRGPLVMKRRFRTKFTPEQKERMLGFAERVGWKLQRREDGEVQQFCQEIGVKRRVLKVWMHNNKHNSARKTMSSGGSPIKVE